ncbi:copper resistance CopC family protein [Gordonia shandongensis]|uniref:copper resistance CopC family protein n=1 Tax=Gordonia shandongensis TaxID=376351 RepID=UPI00054D9024|nr:copper resistance CopC family protein [Gordonia shandongensis]
MSRLFSRLSAFAVVSAMLAVLAAVVAGPAAAHSALVESNPAQDAQLDAAPDRVVLTFNEELKSSYPVLKVVGPDNNFWQRGEPSVSGRDMSVALDGLGPVGTYKVNYRVTSADGHPVEGQVTFELTKAGTGTPGPVADDWEPETDEGGLSGLAITGIVVGIVVVLALIVGSLVVMLVRRRS